MFAWLRSRRRAPDPESALEAARQAFQAGDYGRARALWAPLAEAGHARAQSNLAGLHAEGFGIERNPVEAARWFAIAARAGDSEAQAMLGAAYHLGLGVAPDQA